MPATVTKLQEDVSQIIAMLTATTSSAELDETDHHYVSEISAASSSASDDGILSDQVVESAPAQSSDASAPTGSDSRSTVNHLTPADADDETDAVCDAELPCNQQA